MRNNNIETEPTTGPKPGISAFYQYHSGYVFYYRRIARKAEAGRGGIPRSINKSATCPAMWRQPFSGGGHFVRLSANGCQPHRPNTALLFCAAGYHPGLLRTFREHDLNFYSMYAISFSPFSSVSITMVCPSLIFPSRMILAARVSTFFWRYLLSGRAP